MRKACRRALFGAFALVTALDIGAYVRNDYRLAEPARDIAVGLGALAVVAVAGWAVADPKQEGAEVER